MDNEKPRGKHVEETWRVRVGRGGWQKSHEACASLFFFSTDDVEDFRYQRQLYQPITV